MCVSEVLGEQGLRRFYKLLAPLLDTAVYTSLAITLEDMHGTSKPPIGKRGRALRSAHFDVYNQGFPVTISARA